MFSSPPHLSRSCFFLLAGCVAVLPGHGSDKPVAPPGYHMVPVAAGGHTGYVQVKDETSPFHGVDEGGSSSEKPDQFSFGKTSDFANKTYNVNETAVSPDGSSYQKNLEHNFVTKSYFPNGTEGANNTTPGLHSSVPVNTADGFSQRASGYDKSFTTSRADADQDKTAAFASVSSKYQNQTALLGGHDVKTYASSMADMTYHGREVAAVKRDLDRMNNGLESVKDLPDRPLSIDEVRALINHGVKPDLDEKAAEPSKPLNDPGYEPDPAPAPLRDPSAPPASPNEEGVPAPGTMSAMGPPENSEPLPK